MASKKIAKLKLTDLLKRFPKDQVNNGTQKRADSLPSVVNRCDWENYSKNVRSEYARIIDNFDKQSDVLNSIAGLKDSHYKKYLNELGRMRTEVQAEIKTLTKRIKNDAEQMDQIAFRDVLDSPCSESQFQPSQRHSLDDPNPVLSNKLKRYGHKRTVDYLKSLDVNATVFEKPLKPSVAFKKSLVNAEKPVVSKKHRDAIPRQRIIASTKFSVASWKRGVAPNMFFVTAELPAFTLKKSKSAAKNQTVARKKSTVAYKSVIDEDLCQEQSPKKNRRTVKRAVVLKDIGKNVNDPIVLSKKFVHHGGQKKFSTEGKDKTQESKKRTKIYGNEVKRNRELTQYEKVTCETFDELCPEKAKIIHCQAVVWPHKSDEQKTARPVMPLSFESQNEINRQPAGGAQKPTIPFERAVDATVKATVASGKTEIKSEKIVAVAAEKPSLATVKPTAAIPKPAVATVKPAASIQKPSVAAAKLSTAATQKPAVVCDKPEATVPEKPSDIKEKPKEPVVTYNVKSPDVSLMDNVENLWHGLDQKKNMKTFALTRPVVRIKQPNALKQPAVKFPQPLVEKQPAVNIKKLEVLTCAEYAAQLKKKLLKPVVEEESPDNYLMKLKEKKRLIKPLIVELQKREDFATTKPKYAAKEVSLFPKKNKFVTTEPPVLPKKNKFAVKEPINPLKFEGALNADDIAKKKEYIAKIKEKLGYIKPRTVKTKEK